MSTPAVERVLSSWAPIVGVEQRQPAQPTAPAGPIGSPQWWLTRLYAHLSARLPDVSRFDAYYRGDHPLPWLPEQARDEFRRILRMTRSNYLGLVCDALVERCTVEGFRIGGAQEADRDAWRVWQANRLDTYSDQAFLEAAKAGCSYLLVGPNPDDPQTPLVTVEHPAQAIVETEPGSLRRAAGLKAYRDDWTGGHRAMLLLPTGTYRFVAPHTATGRPQWQPDGDPQPPPVTGLVSLVEVPNNPQLGIGGVSELRDLTDIQDRVNKTIADRLITQDFGAFPQKWATGWPTVDEAGIPTPPIEVGRDRLVQTDVQEARLGQWEAAPLDPYSAAKREDVKDIASRSRTPAQYLLGELTNVNGETLKAAESGLVSKVRQRCRGYGEAIEDVVRLARALQGVSGGEPVETLWRNPEFRTEGETVDAISKMRTMVGLPRRAAWERWGASQQEMDRWEQMLRAEAAEASLTDPLAALADTERPMDAQDLQRRTAAAGNLVRAGFVPEEAARIVGLEGVAHTGLVSSSVKPLDGE